MSIEDWDLLSDVGRGDNRIRERRDIKKETNLTKEQSIITKYRGGSFKINAYAGSGKTYTLGHYIQGYRREKICYMAFNKSIKEEAQEKFRKHDNIKVFTTHGLAYQDVLNYKHKIGSITIKQLRDFFNNEISYKLCVYCLGVLHNFFISSDDYINKTHIPNILLSKEDKENIDINIIMSLCNQILEGIIDYSGGINLPHDGYLKMFQLAKQHLGYDMILLDEAQDSNDCVLSILRNQEDTRILLAGDTYQSIYQFRGATNAMESFDTNETFYLTQSFRFGNKIAELADNILLFKDIETGKVHKKLEGLSSINDEIIYFENDIDFIKNNNIEGHKTILTRTNSEIFKIAEVLISQNKTFDILGDIEKEKYMNYYYLYSGAPKEFIKDEFLKTFKSFDELFEEAKKTGEKDIISICNLVQKINHSLPQILDEIENRKKQSKDFCKSEYLLTTSHKSKGSEYDVVILSDSFINYDTYCKDKKEGEDVLEELNLLYVAITRAKKTLCLNEGYNKFVY